MDNKSSYPATQQGYPPQPDYPLTQAGHPPTEPIYSPTQPDYQPGYPPTQTQPDFQAPPPPPPYYNQTTGGILATVYVTHAVVPQLGPTPLQMQCPSCNATILTNVRYKANAKTHFLAALLCCLLCWPLAWLPYCMNSCQSGNHYCPNCNSFLGTYNKDGC